MKTDKQLEGSVDLIGPHAVGGWARSPDGPVRVQVICDGVEVAEAKATFFRTDLNAENKGDVAFSFAITVPDNWTLLEVRCPDFSTQLPNNIIVRGQESLGKHPLSAYADSTFWHLIHHFTRAPFPTTKPFITSGIKHPDEIAIANRLCDYLEKCLSLTPAEEWSSSGMWDEISSSSFPLLDRYAKERDIEGLLSRLRIAQQLPETNGMGPGSIMADACKSEAGFAINSLTVDRLLAAAEAIGSIPIENPEQGRFGFNVLLSVDEIVKKIEQVVKFSILRKPVMGVFGISVGESIIDSRVPDDLYTAWRLKQLADTEEHVAEIGGGFGGCCEFAVRAGFKNYTIYDLPHVGLLQGYFLCLTVGAENVWFEGEPERESMVRIRPFFQFEPKYDVYVNRDSLPELPINTVKAFLSRISKGKKSSLLSINQESENSAMQAGTNQLRVFSVAQTYETLRLRSRHPYWIRKGYVEEVYTTE